MRHHPLSITFVLMLAILLPAVLVPTTAAAFSLEPAPVPVYKSTDMVVAGLGALRDTEGTITLSGVGDGEITSAWLYWNSAYNYKNSSPIETLSFAETTVTGTSLERSYGNCLGDDLFSWSVRADVTALVTGDGDYPIANTFSTDAFIEGASLIVFFDDGNSANDRNVYIYDGNDGNSYPYIQGPTDPPDTWDTTLSNIDYHFGPAEMTLHVAGGELSPDGTIELNGTTFASGQVFDGQSVPLAQTADAGFWDIKSWDISSYLTAGTNTLQLTHELEDDCFSLIVATVSVMPDTTAPELEVTAITSGGIDYTPGEWTNQPVSVTIACTDDSALASGIETSVTTTLSTNGPNQSVASQPCTDLAGNVATPLSVTDIDIDQTAPMIQPLGDQTHDPTSPQGAPVFFTPVVTDTYSSAGNITASCTDQFSNPFSSGSFAPIGMTIITCTATDLAGNSASESFTVTVRSVGSLWEELRAMIIALDLASSTERTLLTQATIGEASSNAGQPGMACLQLSALDMSVKSQESKRRIIRQDAAAIYAQTQQIRNVIGCGGTST